MHRPLLERLLRQWKAFQILGKLQREEFALLRERDPQAVASVEFSIHELMRQIVDERQEVRAMLQGRRLRQFIKDLPEGLDARTLLPDFDCIRGLPALPPGIPLARVYAVLHDMLDNAEQDCARQAEKNTALALGLFDQSQNLLSFLHEQVKPKPAATYSKYGALRKQQRPEAALIQGRL